MGTFKHKSYICLVGTEPTQEQKDDKEIIYITKLTNCIISNREVKGDDTNCYYMFNYTCDENEADMIIALKNT